MPAPTGALTASELEQLVSCCPALKSLGLKRSLQYDVTLDPLLRLSGLTSLALVHGPPDDSLGVLQQLTGLRSLEIGEHVVCVGWGGVGGGEMVAGTSVIAVVAAIGASN